MTHLRLHCDKAFRMGVICWRRVCSHWKAFINRLLIYLFAFLTFLTRHQSKGEEVEKAVLNIINLRIMDDSPEVVASHGHGLGSAISGGGVVMPFAQCHDDGRYLASSSPRIITAQR